jgi:uncharacterized coiled-coil protein SlyX
MKWMCCIVALLAWAAPGLAEPIDVETELAELRAKLARQDEVIASMQDRLGDNWLNSGRAEQVKQLVREVLADAETRASLMDSSITAGHDGSSFIITDEQSNFLLKVKGMVQVRHTYNHQDNSGVTLGTDASPDDSRGGFGITRTRFGFLGHVVDPTWKYVIWAGYDCSGNSVVLDANITKVLGDGWSVTGGQFKLPFQYEYLVSETRLQFIERSLVAGEFCGTYTQGVMVTYQNDWFRGRGSFNDGASTINTIWHTRTSEYAATARGELKLFGDWKDYADWEGWLEQEPLFVVGAALHWQEDEWGTADAGEVMDTRWTIDASYERSGFNVFVAVVGQHVGGDAGDRIAAMGQGGLFVTPDLELICRYEWAEPDVAGEEDLNILSVGANYFFAGHQLKLSADVGYAFNAVGASYASNPLGYRLDAPDSDGQLVVRSQIQLLF